MVGFPAVVAAVSALVGSPLTSTGLDRVCRDLVVLLPVDGLAITITTPRSGWRVVVGASDPVVWWWEQAEATTGIGPATEATTTGCVVAVDDLAADLGRWPGLGEQLAGAGIGAVNATALPAGQTVIGSLDGYRTDRHPWTAAELADIGAAARVLAVALAVAPMADRTGGGEEGDRDGTGWLGPGQAGVAQATGMVMAALGLPVADAVSRLRGAAFTRGRLITAVAADITAGRLPATLT